MRRDTRASKHRRRRVRFSAAVHQEREKEQRRVRQSSGASDERVEAHEPSHATGCLRCFMARQEARRAELDQGATDAG